MREKPSIYTYLEYRNWVEDWFLYQKEQKKQYSFRMIARMCNQQSPSFLRDVIHGRRNLTPELIERLSTLMKLDDDEKLFFSDLFLLEHEKNEEQKQIIFERITSIQRLRNARRIEGDGFRYLSNWYCPAIRELSLRSDFRPEPQWIVDTLCPSITLAQAAEALQILQDLEMLIIHDDMSCETKDVSIVTANQVQGIAVHRYHSQMLSLAQESLTRFTEEERHVMGVTVCIPQSLMPKLKEEINGMAARLLDMCDNEQKNPDMACQIGLYVFPLSLSKKENQ